MKSYIHLKKISAYKIGLMIIGLLLVVGLLLLRNGNAWSMKYRSTNLSRVQGILSPDGNAIDFINIASFQAETAKQLTSTITSTLNLPIVQLGFVTERPLGDVQLLSGPATCDGQDCYQLRVSCPNLLQTDDVTLKVGEPISSTFKGTIIFATGWTGTYYWDGTSINLAKLEKFNGAEDYIPSLAVMGNNADIIQNLRLAGYRTVQLKWVNNWFKSQLGAAEGIANLACRPATVAKWTYHNLHTPNNNSPYCAVGHSNGASQIGYSITQFGQSDLFSAVVFESGPNWSRIDTACLHDDPSNQGLFADQGERNTIDWGFGFNSDGSGACAQMDSTYRPNFRSSSLALGGWSYAYPDLKVGFVFGGADKTTTAAQGMYYHDLLVDSGTPSATLTVVPGAPHFVTETPEGAQAMESTILSLCQ